MDIQPLKNAASGLDKWLDNTCLRYYQKDAISKIVSSVIRGNNRIIIKMPVGTGKVFTLVKLLQFTYENNTSGKTLVLTTNREIVAQFSTTTKQHLNVSHVNKLGESSRACITVTTYVDLWKNSQFLQNYDFIICLDSYGVKHEKLECLFKNNTNKEAIYLAIDDNNNRFKQSPFFEYLDYSYSFDENARTGEQAFVNEFLVKLFKSMGYDRVDANDAQHLVKLPEGKRLSHSDMLVYENEKPKFLVEAKLYRGRNVSLNILEQALSQAVFHKINSAVDECILVLLCEAGEEFKDNAKNNHGVIVWDIANLSYLCENNSDLTSMLYEFASFSLSDITFSETKGFPKAKNTPNATLVIEEQSEDFINRLKSCAFGRKNGVHAEYEALCEDIIRFLFESEFDLISSQHKTKDKIFRMDLLCSLKGNSRFWKFIQRHYNSVFVVFEFKNYNEKIDQNLIYITEKYLYNATLRNVAIIISRRGFHKNATHAALGALRENGKLILDVNDEDLITMIKMKKIGKEPSDELLHIAEKLLMSISK